MTMNAYKFKREYVVSKRTILRFRVAFVLVAVSFFLSTGAVFLPSDESYTLNGGTLVTLLFWLIFCLVFLLLCANFVLWIGMLQFLFKYDGRAAGRKAPWFLITFFGLSFGAGLYYLLVYRKFLERIPPLHSADSQAQPA